MTAEAIIKEIYTLKTFQGEACCISFSRISCFLLENLTLVIVLDSLATVRGVGVKYLRLIAWVSVKYYTSQHEI